MAFAFQIGTGASQDRLEKLIALRLQPGQDKAAIDARIWDLFGETWAIMFTDLSGFSRRAAEFGIIHFLQTIYESQRLLIPLIDDFDGILLKTEGDSLLILFRSPAKAVECAVKMQRELARYNADKSEAERVLLCVGIGYGEVLRIGDSDVFGAQVNAAAKLGEDTAKAYELPVTDTVKEALGERADLRYRPVDFVPPGARAAYMLEYR